MKLDDANPTNSNFDLHIYRANAVAPPIGEEDKHKRARTAGWPTWTTHALISFHADNVTRTSDGKLQVPGDLVLTAWTATGDRALEA